MGERSVISTLSFLAARNAQKLFNYAGTGGIELGHTIQAAEIHSRQLDLVVNSIGTAAQQPGIMKAISNAANMIPPVTVNIHLDKK